MDDAVMCRVPSIRLQPYPFDLNTGGGAASRTVVIHVDPAVLALPAFSAGLANFKTAFQKLLPDIEKLAQSVAARLGYPMPLVYVICEGVLGFNYRGGVYLNVWPLAHVNLAVRADVMEAASSMLLTLLHEVAHWSHVAHDAGFADTFGKLVWAFRGSLP